MIKLKLGTYSIPFLTVVDFENSEIFDAFRALHPSLYWTTGQPLSETPRAISIHWKNRRYICGHQSGIVWGSRTELDCENWRTYFTLEEEVPPGHHICIPIEVGFMQSKLVCKICDKNLCYE